MNVNKSSLFWGMLLIIGGALALAQQMGYVGSLTPEMGMYSFAAVSLLSTGHVCLEQMERVGLAFSCRHFRRTSSDYCHGNK